MLTDKNIFHTDLAEVKCVCPDMEQPVEGVDDQEDDEDGHDYLICVAVHDTGGMRQRGVDHFHATVHQLFFCIFHLQCFHLGLQCVGWKWHPASSPVLLY